MVSAGEDSNLFVFDFIDKTVFRIDSARPAAGEFMFSRLGFAGPKERVPLDFPDKLNDSKGLFAILFNLPCEVFKRVGVKFQALCRLCQKGYPLFGFWPRSAVFSSSRF